MLFTVIIQRVISKQRYERKGDDFFLFFFNRKIHRTRGLTLFGDFVRPRFRLIPLLLDFFSYIGYAYAASETAFGKSRRGRCIRWHSLPIANAANRTCGMSVGIVSAWPAHFVPFRKNVHPSDVATRRCTSRVLVTGLLERIVVYPDYWHNLAITGQRSGSENRWSYDFKARECCNSRETISRALAFLEKVKSRPRLHLRLGRSFNVLSVFANIFNLWQLISQFYRRKKKRKTKRERERETRSLIGQDLRQTRCSACC